MSRRFPELVTLRVSIDPDTRERHLATINVALREHRAPRFRRLRLMAVAAGLVLLIPVLALAAENSVPGDFLYRVKRLFEPVVEVVDEDVDEDVRASHRIDELEELVDRRAPAEVIDRQLLDAREAASDRHHKLGDRLDRLAGEVAEQRGDDEFGVSDVDDGSPVEEEPANDRASTTTTSESGTTTQPHNDSTRPRDGLDG